MLQKGLTLKLSIAKLLERTIPFLFLFSLYLMARSLQEHTVKIYGCKQKLFAMLLLYYQIASPLVGFALK